jgi:hypothetical protein
MVNTQNELLAFAVHGLLSRTFAGISTARYGLTLVTGKTDGADLENPRAGR